VGARRKTAFGAIEARQELATWCRVAQEKLAGEATTISRDSLTKHDLA
jgi:hypothetical protein